MNASPFSDFIVGPLGSCANGLQLTIWEYLNICMSTSLSACPDVDSVSFGFYEDSHHLFTVLTQHPFNSEIMDLDYNIKVHIGFSAELFDFSLKGLWSEVGFFSKEVAYGSSVVL